MKTLKIILLLIICISILYSCDNNKKAPLKSGIKISDVNLLTNYQQKDIQLDYEDAINTGFVIPSNNQTNNGKFDFDFVIENETDYEQKYFYKIYYQNESYKWPDANPINESMQHEFAHENFYGSWEDTDIEFKSCGKIAPGEKLKITDKFRIVGNPRNEEQYFYKGENDRWKRNPRVGVYSFMIVVVTEKDINNIPDFIKDVNKQNKDQFINPFYYFLHGQGKDITNCEVNYNNNIIKVKASPMLGQGIFIDKFDFSNRDDQGFTDFYDCNCNNSADMDNKANIAQFIHYIDESSQIDNVPIIQDFFGDNFSKEEYNYLRAFYKKEDRIKILPQTASKACETVKSDSIEGKIIIRNPASEYGKWQKQNVGMITRHGFTYGKFTVKAKLTELLNDDNVWNGITNAIWLIYQGGRGSNATGWNLRRPCKEKGYMKNYWGGRLDQRVERVAYSEIDFEILKTVPYCPSSKFPPNYSNYEAHTNRVKAWNTKLPEDVLKDDANIAVCCTNWDMACWEPKNFSGGCHEIKHNDKTYLAHRWDDTYRAVTTKHMAPDDQLFANDYYYFQIDWQPDKIIWRIGPEKDQLIEVGYIDQTISMIPDNQMLLIVTQEFHNTNWWPGSPYQQENIPFPEKDYVGEIYEITIE
ncbi:MAG: hypothetical protein RBR97_13345 [Bacteroidales bacterium]|nr:hypothetical protein [Bacteroidales bacterium]